MLVSVDQLNAFDLLVWLRTGERAADRLRCSQPTVSRSAKHVASVFGLDLHRIGGEWTYSGHPKLLNHLRKVHQQSRWLRHEPLRLEAHYCNGPLLLEPCPAGWICGGFDFLEIQSPLALLRDGVIDAWLGVYPDVPQHDPELAVIHLTRQPTLLTLPCVVLPIDVGLMVGDTLVVRRAYAEHPTLRELVELLRQRTVQLADQMPDLQLLH